MPVGNSNIYGSVVAYDIHDDESARGWQYWHDSEDLFRAGTLSLPKFGQYRLVVWNLGNDSRIARGKISLIRDENTEDAAVLSGVLRLLKWLFLIVAIVSGGRLAFAWWKQRRQPSNTRAQPGLAT